MLGNHRHREGDSDHGFVTESHGSATDEAGSPMASASFFGVVIIDTERATAIDGTQQGRGFLVVASPCSAIIGTESYDIGRLLRLRSSGW